MLASACRIACSISAALRSLRAYTFDLLHFARWWLQDPAPALLEVTESTLLDYVRPQLDQQPTPQTVNHRLTVIRNLYRLRFDCERRLGLAQGERG